MDKERVSIRWRVSSEKEPTDPPFITQKSKRTNTSKPNGRHHVYTDVLKDPNCEVCKTKRPPKLRAGSARKREETVFIHKMLVMLERRITMSHMKRANLVRRIVTQSWYKTFPSFYCVQCHPTKKKDCAGDVEKFKRSCRRSGTRCHSHG